MNKSRGFGLAYAVVLLAVVAAVGIGVYVLNKDKTEYSSNSATNSPSAQTPSQNQQKPERSYLIVKEWGIKLPLSEEIVDAYYYIAGGSQVDSEHLTTVRLGVRSFDMTGHCAANDTTLAYSPLAAIIRSKQGEKHPITGELFTEKYPAGAEIDGYYYGYDSDLIKNKPCTDEASYQAELQKINTAFAEAAKNIIAE